MAVDNDTAAPFVLTDIAGWNTWRDVTVKGVRLEAGQRTLLLLLDTGDVNLNSLDIVMQSSSMETTSSVRVEVENYTDNFDTT